MTSEWRCGVIRCWQQIDSRHSDAPLRVAAGRERRARYYDEQVKNRANRDEIAAILTKYTPVKNRELYDRITFPYAPPDGAITMSGLADMAKYFASHGGSDVGDVKKIVDDRFRAAAVAKLGPESK